MPDQEESPEEAAASQKLRAVAFNIRHAQGTEGFISTARVAKTLRGLRPDVVAATEVWRAAKWVDQPSRLAELTGMHAEYLETHKVLLTHTGNLVLSPDPPLSTRVIELGGKREQRACLLAELEVRGMRFIFGAVHLSLDRAGRARQLVQLAEELPRDVPLLLGGDFNAGHEELGPLRALLTFPAEVPATFPVPLPFRAIDHIGYSRHWRLDGLRAVDSFASDHRPLVADLVMLSSGEEVPEGSMTAATR